jgi:hypothetical protein
MGSPEVPDPRAANEAALLKSVHDAYIEVTKATLATSLTRVNVVTGSVAAIATIYTGLLALVYAAKPNEGSKLDFEAVLPGVFLGMSLVLVSIYAAMLKKGSTSTGLLPSGDGGDIVQQRLILFMQWAFNGMLKKTWALNAGIVSMGVGVVYLPLPFLRQGSVHGFFALLIGVCVVIILTIVMEVQSTKTNTSLVVER